MSQNKFNTKIKHSLTLGNKEEKMKTDSENKMENEKIIQIFITKS